MTRSLGRMPALIIAAAAVMLAAACSSGSATSSTSHGATAKMTAIRIQVFPGAYTDMPIRVAEDLGLFAKYGLKPTFVPAQSSSAAIAAMLGGSVDFVQSGGDLVLGDVAKGLKIQYVSAYTDKNFATLVVSKHVDLTPSQEQYPAVMHALSGKNFGVNALGATLYNAAKLMFKDADAAAPNYVVTGTATTTLAAWRRGAVDAQLTFAPVPEMLETLGVARTLFSLADAGPKVLATHGLYAGYVATTSYIAEHADTVRKFIQAISAAVHWLQDPGNESKAIQLAKKYAPVSALSPSQNASVLAKMVKDLEPYWGVQISPTAIAEWNTIAKDEGLITRDIPFDEVVYKGAPTCTTKCR